MKNNRIILINSLTSGGAERVALCIAESLSVPVLTIWPEKFYDTNKVITTSLLDKKGFLIFDLIYAFFALLVYIKKNKVNVINSHLFWCHYISITTSFFLKHKTVATHCVSFSSKFDKKSIAYFFHYFFSNILLKKVDVNIYKSKAMKAEYESVFNLFNGKVIYNPIDKDVVNQLARSDVKFKFKDNVTYLLCVGRFHPTKNQKLLIKALEGMERFKIVDLNVEVIFLGQGLCLSDCKQYALRSKVSTKIHFLGNVKNPYPYYKNCQFYTSFSSSEGFPNALMEALALNCYPIHSDCRTGPREILTDYKEYQVRESKEDWYEIVDFGSLFKVNSISSFINAFYFRLKHGNTGNKSPDDMLKALGKNKIMNNYKNIFEELN